MVYMQVVLYSYTQKKKKKKKKISGSRYYIGISGYIGLGSGWLRSNAGDFTFHCHFILPLEKK